MKARLRPSVLLETRSGYPYRYRQYASRQGAMRSASIAKALSQRIRILSLPGGAYTWLRSGEPTPVLGKLVSTFDGIGWSKP